jgi:hypothetical protein
VKKILLASSVVLALTLTSAAADKKPAASQHKAGTVEEVKLAPQSPTPQPPGLCSPCLFYGGDLDVSDSNAAGLSDENTLLVLGSSTYTAYSVPSGAWVGITGILVNVQASVNFDPQTAAYDVRTGVTEGNGGSEVTSGTGSISVAATGRNFIGLNEYTVLVKIPTLYLGPGEYWFNVTPQCTNGATDGSCYEGRIFISNTTENTNAVHGGAQPAGSMYLNSSYFGFTWANWCDSSLGLNSNQCRAASFGLTGSGKGGVE